MQEAYRMAAPICLRSAFCANDVANERGHALVHPPHFSTGAFHHAAARRRARRTGGLLRNHRLHQWRPLPRARSATHELPDLGDVRNSIYAENGYCFRNPGYRSLFGKPGCRHKSAGAVPAALSAPMSPRSAAPSEQGLRAIERRTYGHGIGEASPRAIAIAAFLGYFLSKVMARRCHAAACRADHIRACSP